MGVFASTARGTCIMPMQVKVGSVAVVEGLCRRRRYTVAVLALTHLIRLPPYLVTAGAAGAFGLGQAKATIVARLPGTPAAGVKMSRLRRRRTRRQKLRRPVGSYMLRLLMVQDPS
jgi:hypothetical protein